jgi:3-isopropylmalate/(R)-2-methylmalate dehydratase large subunit
MQERMTLSNMSAELGAQVGSSRPTRPPRDFLAKARCAPRDDMARWFTDEDADFTRHRFDAASLEPHRWPRRTARPTRTA